MTTGSGSTQIRKSSDRFQSLLHATSSLLTAGGLSATFEKVLDFAEQLVGADAFALWRASHDGSTWSAAAFRHLSSEFPKTVSAWPNSLTAQLLQRATFIADSRNIKGLEYRSEAFAREGIRSILVLPLFFNGEPKGTVNFYFHRSLESAPEDIDVIDAFGGIVSAAIATAELLESKRREQVRSDFLSQASATLTSSLDYQDTLSSVARLAVPAIADWCVVSVLSGGHLEQLAVAHSDPAKAQLAEKIRGKYPEIMKPGSAVARVVESGKSEIVNSVTDEMLQAAAKDAEHLEVLRSLGLRSALVVPICAREHVIGLIRLVNSDSGRAFVDDDVTLAEELGRRAAMAIENARLHHQLQLQEAEHRLVLDSLPALVAYVDKERRYAFVNEAYKQWFGRDNIEGQYIPHVIGEAAYESVRHHVERALSGETVTYEESVPFRFGRRFIRATYLPSRNAAGEVNGYVSFVSDISAEREADEKLQKVMTALENERAWLQAMVDNVPVGILFAEAPNGRVVFANHQVEKILRHPALYSSDVSSYRDWVAFHPNGTRVESHEYPLARAIREEVTSKLDVLYRRGDGTLAWLSIIGTPVRDSSGRVTGALVAMNDIDELKRAQEETNRQSRRVREILESTKDAVFMLDRLWRFSYLNQNAVELIAEGRDLIGSSIWESFPDAVGTIFWDTYQRVMSGGGSEVFESFYAPLNKWFEVRVHSTDEGVAVFFEDVTERRKAMEAMLKSEKLAAAGRLAASISHEINNPLASVTNILYLLETSSDFPDALRSLLSTASQELARVSHIATQTLRFYRQSTKRESADVPALLDSVLALFQGRLRNQEVTIERQYGPAMYVSGFSGELRQVFSNLVGNALDAMSTPGGRLIVRVYASHDWITRAPGMRVVVADTGSGMTRETRRKLFEPFYSTKGIGGTGLGLWVSKEIIDKHHGTVRVRSREGCGTVFSVFLPAAPAVTEKHNDEHAA